MGAELNSSILPTQAEFVSLVADFASLSRIGRTPAGGVNREAATIADGQARTWFSTWLELNGFEVRVDPIGNVFGLVTLVPGAPYVLMGSHLDSQPYAGRYDGAYGVLAAAHAAKHVVDRISSGKLQAQYNVAVVDWFNEEGSRFAPSMMGSSVFTGKLGLAEAYGIRDKNGTSVREALERIGHLGTDTPPTVCAYAEVHVEQGRDMADHGVTIGIVESNWAARKFSVTVKGEQAHTGSTRMSDRHDALYGASLFVSKLRELTAEFEQDVLHTSVGQFEVRPNSPVVVASRVELLADIRSADEKILARANERVAQIIADVERQASVEVTLTETHNWGVQEYQRAGVELCEDLLATSPYTHVRTVTLAGHDSTNMKDVVPTVMLFVPSEGGVAHNESEYTTDSDLVAGMDVLQRVLARLVEGAMAGPAVFVPAVG